MNMPILINSSGFFLSARKKAIFNSLNRHFTASIGSSDLDPRLHWTFFIRDGRGKENLFTDTVRKEKTSFSNGIAICVHIAFLRGCCTQPVCK